jgi:SAM-dependent methyltransferase
VQIINNIVDMLRRDREQTLTATESFIRRNIKPAATDRVLDIGASTGRYLSLLAGSGAELIGLDIDAFSLLVASELWCRLLPSERRTFVVADALTAPLAPESVSILSSFVTLSSLPVRQTLRTFHRALRRGGTLLLTIEGPGFLTQISKTLPIIDARRIGLLRWYIGQQLLSMGVDWQQRAQTRRLAGVTTFSKTTISRYVREAGFTLEVVEVLARHGNEDRLYGIVATRQ